MATYTRSFDVTSATITLSQAPDGSVTVGGTVSGTTTVTLDTGETLTQPVSMDVGVLLQRLAADRQNTHRANLKATLTDLVGQLKANKSIGTGKAP